MRETPEQVYVRNSLELGIEIETELVYWASKVLEGKRTETQTISVGDIVAGTTFDCMTVLELFAAEAKRRNANESRREKDAVQQAAVDVLGEPHRRGDSGCDAALG